LTERPVVGFAQLQIRPALENDAEALEALRLGDTPWAKEVEGFIRDKALKRHLNLSNTKHHRLLVLTDETGKVVGAAAHRAAEIPFPPGTDGHERGTRLVFVALDVAYQGHNLPDGHPISGRLMELLLDDVASHREGRLLEGTVHKGNGPSIKLCGRYGLDPVQDRGDYIQLLGALPVS
jgi:hypothetical protein